MRWPIGKPAAATPVGELAYGHASKGQGARCQWTVKSTASGEVTMLTQYPARAGVYRSQRPTVASAYCPLASGGDPGGKPQIGRSISNETRRLLAICHRDWVDLGYRAASYRDSDC